MTGERATTLMKCAWSTANHNRHRLNTDLRDPGGGCDCSVHGLITLKEAPDLLHLVDGQRHPRAGDLIPNGPAG